MAAAIEALMMTTIYSCTVGDIHDTDTYVYIYILEKEGTKARIEK